MVRYTKMKFTQQKYMLITLASIIMISRFLFMLPNQSIFTPNITEGNYTTVFTVACVFHSMKQVTVCMMRHHLFCRYHNSWMLYTLKSCWAAQASAPLNNWQSSIAIPSQSRKAPL